MAYASDTRTTSASIGDRVRELRSTLATRYAQHKVYRSTLKELESLTDRDLADLGLNRLVIQDVARKAAYES